MKRMSCAIAAVLVLALIGGVALAVGGPERLRQVIGGGATSVSGGEVMLLGTLGQPVVGGITSDGEVGIGQGFWSGCGGAGQGSSVFLPLILRQ
ncbi:MAG: hypothetical protein ACK2U2_10570 [Anaerolineae bacterium]|jgi:hypothetical protein